MNILISYLFCPSFKTLHVPFLISESPLWWQIELSPLDNRKNGQINKLGTELELCNATRVTGLSLGLGIGFEWQQDGRFHIVQCQVSGLTGQVNGRRTGLWPGWVPFRTPTKHKSHRGNHAVSCVLLAEILIKPANVNRATVGKMERVWVEKMEICIMSALTGYGNYYAGLFGFASTFCLNFKSSAHQYNTNISIFNVARRIRRLISKLIQLQMFLYNSMKTPSIILNLRLCLYF